MQRDEPLYLSAETVDLGDPRTEDELIDAVQKHLRELGYRDLPADGWRHPDRPEMALAFPGTGDREGEWCLCHFGLRSVHFHKLRNHEALEARVAALPALSETFHEAGGGLREALGGSTEPAMVVLMPRPPNRAERRRLKRRRAA